MLPTEAVLFVDIVLLALYSAGWRLLTCRWPDRSGDRIRGERADFDDRRLVDVHGCAGSAKKVAMLSEALPQQTMESKLSYCHADPRDHRSFPKLLCCLDLQRQTPVVYDLLQAVSALGCPHEWDSWFFYTQREVRNPCYCREQAIA